MQTTEDQVKKENMESDEARAAKIAEQQIKAKELLKGLVEAGVHFGHETQKRNPKMQDFIHSQKNGMHIIDLTKTVAGLMRSADYLKKQVRLDKNVLFVGTSKVASDLVQQEAQRAGAFFINQRWLGGLLTNFDVIRSRLNKLKELEISKETGAFKGLGKKELSSINRQILKLNKSLGGLKKMRGKPDIIVVFDQNKDRLAVIESKKLGSVSIIAITDTDCDPTGIDFPIPANDDSLSSLEFIAKFYADTILEAKERKRK